MRALKRVSSAISRRICPTAGSARSAESSRLPRDRDAGCVAAACFDSLTQQYLGSYAATSLNGHVLRARQERIIELMRDLPPGRILDIGCGPATIAGDLLALGHDYIGIDASSNMIRVARSRGSARGQMSFAVASAERLPFEDAAFDAALCIGVIDRLPDREHALVEMARILRPGGTLLLSFPNRLSPYAAWRGLVFYPLVGLIKRLRAWRRGTAGPDDLYLRSNFRLWAPAEARATVHAVFGEVVDVAYYNFVPLLSPLDELLPGLAARLARRTEAMSRGRLRKFGAGFIVKAQKRPICHSAS